MLSVRHTEQVRLQIFDGNPLRDVTLVNGNPSYLFGTMHREFKPA